MAGVPVASSVGVYVEISRRKQSRQKKRVQRVQFVTRAKQKKGGSCERTEGKWSHPAAGTAVISDQPNGATNSSDVKADSGAQPAAATYVPI